MQYNIKKKNQIALIRLYKTNNKLNKTISSLIGITKTEFINHINKFLLDGMTNENFGTVWGLDHIVPVELFDLTNEDEIKLCYNYNNIMPMFNNDNRMKGASVHFSLDKLNSMPTNINIEQLKEKCINEIDNRYKKYIIV